MSLFGVKTELECLPCFFGQITRALSHAGVNGDRGRDIGRLAEKIIESASLDEVPARTTTRIHRILRNETGVDPYEQVKKSYNLIALDRFPALRRMATEAADRLEGGVRIAIAGNVIDFGIYDSIDLDHSLEESFRLPLSQTGLRNFSREVARAQHSLPLR
jgi:uncharacterized protein with ATP-grasp and redox domains